MATNGKNWVLTGTTRKHRPGQGLEGGRRIGLDVERPAALHQGMRPCPGGRRAGKQGTETFRQEAARWRTAETAGQPRGGGGGGACLVGANLLVAVGLLVEMAGHSSPQSGLQTWSPSIQLE